MKSGFHQKNNNRNTLLLLFHVFGSFLLHVKFFLDINTDLKSMENQELEFLDVFAMHASNALVKAGVLK